MDKVTTRDLYNQLQERIIMDLHENETKCPECQGLKFVFVQKGEKGYIESCRHCYTGKLTVCKYCGKGNKSWCDCKESHEERDNDFRIKQAKKEQEAYEKAEKIHYKDYDGKFWIESYSSCIIDIDDVGEWIYELLQNGGEPPDYLWAIKGHQHFAIDLLDVISDKCEDGYEDMYERLDTKHPLLKQAQELIKQWEKEQESSLLVYDEDYKRAVIIKDLVEEIRKEMKEK